MTDHGAIAAHLRVMSENCDCDADYCHHAEAHDDAPDYDGMTVAYLDLYDEVHRLRAERERLLYVLDGVAGAIDTGRNEPLQVWRDQINIARQALKGDSDE